MKSTKRGEIMMNKNLEEFKYLGVMFNKVDLLDFKTDFLSGVRSNYFNNSTKNSKDGVVSSFINVDGAGYNFSYYIRDEEPLKWELECQYRNKNDRHNVILEKSKIIDDRIYCVECYNRLGFVRKRIYFDIKHQWLKTEFFCNNDNILSFVIKPVIVEGYSLSDEKINEFKNKYLSESYACQKKK